MGVDYSTRVVYGVFAKNNSDAHAALEALYSAGDEDPMPIDGVPGVRVGQRGNAWTGKFRYSLEAGESISASHNGDGHDPIAIADSNAKPEAIREAVGRLGLKPEDLEPVGHYLVTEVW